MNKKYSRLLKAAAKFIISGIALYLVFSKISFNEIFRLIGNAHYKFLLIAILLFLFSKIIAALRLNQFFNHTNIIINEYTNLKLYWLGMFYNLFLPGGISGDGYKIYLINKQLKTGIKPVFRAILIDRLVGLLALAVLASIIFSVAEQIIPYQKLSLLLSIILIVGFWGFLKLFFKKYLEIYLMVFIYSLTVQLLQLICAFFILKALNYNDHLLTYLFLFLISSIISILPVTIGGIGAREITFLTGAQYLSLSPDISIALSLSFYLITVVVSAVGLIWVINPFKIKNTVNFSKVQL
ncbi:MAG: lysylphosphatidylglycerol synthase transmembrane domain-containing protein [Bacteroidales bacterium]